MSREQSPFPYGGLAYVDEWLPKVFDLVVADLMLEVEPFGQADSTYADTGYPEFTALGVAAFLTSRDSLEFMRAIGKDVFDQLVTLGTLAKMHEVEPSKELEKEAEDWRCIIAVLSETDKRTYEALTRAVDEKFEESMAKREEA